MNFQKFFALAKEKGIEQSQIQVGKSSSTSIRLFHHEIESYKIAEGQSVIACGIYNGKFASAKTEKLDKDTFAYLIDQIIDNATHSEKDEGADIFKGSERYHRHNAFNKSLADVKIADKLATLKELENKVYDLDKRISDVQAGYVEIESASEFYNSFGLKLKQRSNYFYYFAEVVARDGEQTKTNFDLFLDNDISKFNVEEFARDVVAKTLSKFNGASIESKKYPTVIDREVFADLVSYFLEATIADEVQRHSSFLEGKLGQKIASNKLTIEEKPLTKNIFFSYFDDEGVAAQNKVIVKKGVLNTYLYNRETAKKDGVESTGNGSWAGSKIGTGFSNVFIRPGKQSFSELIAPIKDGVYITEIMGLGTGMNSNNGDFSCQAEGYRIENGKVTTPLTLITLSGNLLKMLSDIRGFDNNVKMTTGSISVADVYIKKMAIGGK